MAYLKEAKGPVETVSSEDIPPHHAIALPAPHAHAQPTIGAGEEIAARARSSVPSDLSGLTLATDPENRDNDPMLQSFRVEQPHTQPIHPGSYLHVNKALPVERRLSQLTLECWIRPFQLSGWQGLLTQHDYPEHCGVGLFLSEGKIVFGTGSGGSYEAAAFQQTKSGLVKAHRWHHLIGSWDGKEKRIYLDGKVVAEAAFAGPVRPGKTALHIGAAGQDGKAENFENGDVAMCAIYDRALNEEQVKKRFADHGLIVPENDRLLACWAFAEERGVQVADASELGRDARIINRGTWMIGGPSFNASAINRHDSEYDPTKDEKRGHGLRLASDEIYNARWKVNHRFRVPPDAKSDVYAGRFDFKLKGKPMRYHTSFIVRRPESKPKAPSWSSFPPIPGWLTTRSLSRKSRQRSDQHGHGWIGQQPPRSSQVQFLQRSPQWAAYLQGGT